MYAPDRMTANDQRESAWYDACSQLAASLCELTLFEIPDPFLTVEHERATQKASNRDEEQQQDKRVRAVRQHSADQPQSVVVLSNLQDPKNTREAQNTEVGQIPSIAGGFEDFLNVERDNGRGVDHVQRLYTDATNNTNSLVRRDEHLRETRDN